MDSSRPKVLVSWSGGKDSSLALQEVQKSGEFEVAALVTTLTKDFDRISMHGVSRSLLEKQAQLLQLPLEKVWITKGAANVEYETEMKKSLRRYYGQGVRHVVFGDLFLADIRKYREEMLSAVGMRGAFPLWMRDTRALAEQFLAEGFKAKLCTVDPSKLDPKFCGREFDRSLLSEIPENVDPCGENGEFHTFVYAGPIFKDVIEMTIGEVVNRDGFVFADLIPA
ncbi:MAG: diphthine--ammonia ligase [Thaumarchaeota archaeon]|nr:diphthine--ammonia ligase [Nitrososphaerota archaeon]